MRSLVAKQKEKKIAERTEEKEKLLRIQELKKTSEEEYQVSPFFISSALILSFLSF